MAKRLFIGNLSWNTTEEGLTQVFAPYGGENVIMPKDERNRSKGFGFVDVSDDKAEEAINKMNGTDLDGRQIVVNEAQAKGDGEPRVGKKLFVGNVSPSTSEDGLRNAFGENGTVESVAIITDRETGQRRGFAFVEMSNNEEAQAAIEAWNGKELDGNTLEVNISKPKEDRPRRDSGFGGGGREGGYSGGGGGGGRGGWSNNY